MLTAVPFSKFRRMQFHSADNTRQRKKSFNATKMWRFRWHFSPGTSFPFPNKSRVP